MGRPLAFVENLLQKGLAGGTPLGLATLGEILAERSGVLNLGVEGTMLLGASSAYLLSQHTHSLGMGVVGAMAACAALSLLHAVVCVSLAGDQVVSGLGLGFLGSGLSSVIGADMVQVKDAPRLPAVHVSALADLPLVGPALFSQNLVVYLGLALIPVAHLYIFRTRFGLWLRAVGESPAAADAHGLSVSRVRYAHVAAGGALSGLAGAALSLAITPGWVDGMTSGQGWIAVGLVIFSGWSPLRAAWGALLFGTIRQLPLDLQGVSSLPLLRSASLGYALDTLPYVFTILVLVLAARGRLRDRAPSALALPFVRGERGR